MPPHYLLSYHQNAQDQAKITEYDSDFNKQVKGTVELFGDWWQLMSDGKVYAFLDKGQICIDSGRIQDSVRVAVARTETDIKETLAEYLDHSDEEL